MFFLCDPLDVDHCIWILRKTTVVCESIWAMPSLYASCLGFPKPQTTLWYVTSCKLTSNPKRFRDQLQRRTTSYHTFFTGRGHPVMPPMARLRLCQDQENDIYGVPKLQQMKQKPKPCWRWGGLALSACSRTSRKPARNPCRIFHTFATANLPKFCPVPEKYWKFQLSNLGFTLPPENTCFEIPLSTFLHG